MKKRLLTCFTVISMLFITTSHAAPPINSDELLLEMGFNEATVSALTEEAKAEYVQAYLTDPSSVSVQTTVTEFTPIKEISQFLSYSYEELLQMGWTENEIDQALNRINSLRTMSNFQLSETLGIENSEVPITRAVLASDANQEQLLAEINAGIASGTISTSELSFTQTVRSVSDDPVFYQVRLVFDWSNVYTWNLFEDKIPVAWGEILPK